MHIRTERAEMLPGNRMQVMEHVSADAVPSGLELDPTTSAKGAQQRVAQLGQDATEKIPAAALQDTSMPDRGFL